MPVTVQPSTKAGSSRWLSALGEGPEVAGEQRVDRVHAGHEGRRGRAGIEPAGARQPAELHREDEKQDQAGPEDGDRRAEQREEPRAVIDAAVAEARREHAEHDPAQRAEEHRRDHQLQRRGQPLGDVVEHRPLGAEGGAEVAGDEIADIDDVLLRNALVQAPALAGGLDDLRVVHLPLADQRSERVGLGEMREEESDGGDAEQQQRDGEEAAKDVTLHGRSCRRARRTRRRAAPISYCRDSSKVGRLQQAL